MRSYPETRSCVNPKVTESENLYVLLGHLFLDTPPDGSTAVMSIDLPQIYDANVDERSPWGWWLKTGGYQKFPDWVDNELNSNTRWEAT
jgi:hypothetical protein